MDYEDLLVEVQENVWTALMANKEIQSKIIDLKNNLIRYPEECAQKFTLDYISDLISSNILFKTQNFFIIQEYLIDFLLENHIPLGIEIKEIYSVEEIENNLKIYLPSWIAEVKIESNVTLWNNLIKRYGYVRIETLRINVNHRKEDINSRVLKKIETGMVLDSELKDLYDFEAFPLRIVLNYLEKLKLLNIQHIGQIYNLPDYTLEQFKQSRYIFDAFTSESVEENINIIYSNLVDVYNDIISNDLSDFEDDLMPIVNGAELNIEISGPSNITGDSPYQVSFTVTGEKDKD